MNNDEYKRFMRKQERLVELVKPEMDKSCLEWPTVRDMAKRLNVRQDEIIDMVESHDFLELQVGMQMGSAISEFDSKGDYLIEWFGDE